MIYTKETALAKAREYLRKHFGYATKHAPNEFAAAILEAQAEALQSFVANVLFSEGMRGTMDVLRAEAAELREG